MRIALVSRELAPFAGGGIGTYALLMARALRDAGHEVHVLTEPRDQLQQVAVKELSGITVHGVNLESGRAAVEAFVCHPQRHAMAVFEALEALHQRHPFDVVEFPEFWGEGYFALRARRHLGSFAGATLAVRLHTPSRDVRELNDSGWLDREGACLDHMEAFSIRSADVVLSPTRSLLERIRARQGLPAASAVVVHPFDATLAQAAPGGAAARARVLYFGRLEHRKGVQLLVEAAQRLMRAGSELEVVLLGSDTPTGPAGGSMRAHLQSRIEAPFQGRFTFAAGRSREELPQQIAQASVCCFPSIWENFPNVLLEAMSLGTPVIASDAGGMAEIIVHEQSGLLFRSGSVEALASALERMLGDEALRRRCAQAGPERVRSLCDSQQIVPAFEAAVRGPRKGPVAPSGEVGGVAVVIPVFNSGALLLEAVRSAQEQTVAPEEIVVVDDGSTDPQTLSALEALATLPGLKVIRQANRGVGAARNAGIAATLARWILPLDADDLLAPTFIQRTLAAAAREPELAYVTTLVRYFEQELSTGLKGGWIPWGLERDVLPALNVASTCTALLRREVLAAVGGFDEQGRYEDWDLFCALAERGHQGGVVPEFLFHYRMHPTSFMKSLDARGQTQLQARVLARHPDLALDPGRALRLQLAVLSETQRAHEEATAHPPLRYRLVDQLNHRLKAVPAVHSFSKLVAGALRRVRPPGR